MSDQKPKQTVSVGKLYTFIIVSVALSITITGLFMENKSLKKEVKLLEGTANYQTEVTSLREEVTNLSKSK